MDYYSTLGVGKNASQDEIKKAYRSAAMKHHPDRGGDEKKFKEISEAYDILSDPKKKEIFDLGGDPNRQGGGFSGGGFNQGPFEFHFNHGNFDDLFNQFGFGRHPMRRNKTLNINVEITLYDVLTGKELNAEITIPGTNKKKMINISIPAGIEHGQQIRYEGMGDDAIGDQRPGDLIVNVNIAQHPVFRREHNNIIVDKTISIWDAILGCGAVIETLDGKTITLNVPPGTNHGTVLSCRGEGLPILRSRNRGNLLITIKVDIPKNLSQTQIEKLQEVRNIF
jgi:curved DNA-binding protein